MPKDKPFRALVTSSTIYHILILLIYHSKTAIHSYGRNPQLQDAKVNGHALGYRYSITHSGVFFRYFRANFVHYGLKSPFTNSKMKFPFIIKVLIYR